MFGRLLGWYNTIYTFWGLLLRAEFWQVQNSLCVQVLRSPILTALLHGTRAVGVSQTLRRGIFTRQGGHLVRHWRSNSLGLILSFRGGPKIWEGVRQGCWDGSHPSLRSSGTVPSPARVIRDGENSPEAGELDAKYILYTLKERKQNNISTT